MLMIFHSFLKLTLFSNLDTIYKLEGKERDLDCQQNVYVMCSGNQEGFTTIFYQISALCPGWDIALFFFLNHVLFFEYSPSLEHHVKPLPKSAVETWLPGSQPACWRRPG
jgi:hypothetical protein